MKPIEKCPICGGKLSVLETRAVTISGFQTIWRRRTCRVDKGRFTSIELPEALARDVLVDD